MAKESRFSKYCSPIRIWILVGGLLFISSDAFALLHSWGNDITSIANNYDANGKPDLITENKSGNVVEITDHDYGLLDRLERKTQRCHAVSYTYDNNGNRLTVTSPGGTTTNTFDTRNRLETVTTHSGTTTYTYLPTGWTDVVTHGNGTKVDYDYDSVGRTLKITNRAANNSVLSQFDYEYDLNGNRTQQIEIQNGFANTADRTRTTDYVYDDLDRLESFSHVAGSNTENHSYTYYPSYDRKTEVVAKNGVTINNRTFTYDETHWVKTIVEAAGTGGVITYAYDNNGNSLSKTSTVAEGPASTVFTYNSRNQLTTFAAGVAGSEVNKGTYHYNYAGMRIRHLGSERGNIEYVYDDKSIIDELSNNTTTQVAHYSYGDRLLSLKTGNVEQFYHYAALGTTANLTNASGQNQIAYRLDPFGEITQQEGSSLNRQVFTGHEHDTETGLIYMKARFYDPDIGRFINQDTYLGESTTPPSLHRYLYAYGNPTTYIDPDGYASFLSDWNQATEQRTEWYANQIKNAESGWSAFGYGFMRGFAELEGMAATGMNTTSNLIAQGYDNQSARELAATRSDLTSGFEATEHTAKFVRENPAAAASGIHKAAVNFTVDAAMGDREALGALGSAFTPVPGAASKKAGRGLSAGLDAVQTSAAKLKEKIKSASTLSGESSNLGGGNRASTDVGNSIGAQADSEAGKPYNHPVLIGDVPDFYVGPQGPSQTLPATAYRYMDSAYAERTIAAGEAPLSYFGFTEFKTASEARDAFQVFYEQGNPNSWSDTALRGRFDTIQLYDPFGNPNVRVPMEAGDRGVVPEPFTTYYPQYGKGGERQLVPQPKIDVKFDEVQLLPE